MVKIGPPCGALNTLDVQTSFTYAITCKKTWQMAKFFVDELHHASVGDIELEDPCDICAEEFFGDVHRAVKLPCNHVFGRKCIERWLTPSLNLDGASSLGANTCPKCRRVFFPQQIQLDSPNSMELRIKFWDLAYAHVGIALSESERQVRADLLRYISSSPDFNRRLPSDTDRPVHMGYTHRVLIAFCRHLRSHTLTPVQKDLRQRLETIAVRSMQTRNAPDGVRYWRDDHGELFFEARHGWDPVKSSQSDAGIKYDDHEERVDDEDESDVLVEGDDTETMRFFRALFR
ncbi:hypothetical protein MMC07_008520, partial [Pseudocyphellaria aurata]|nr:hypothetical protein [Pseudocyphellaria aurata]